MADLCFRILCIDNDPDIHRILMPVFTRRGHSYTMATCGGNGLASMLTHPCDVAIIELKLPDMTGVEVCRKIRADARFNAIPLVLFSSHFRDIDVFKAFVNDLRVDLVLSKPFVAGELAAQTLMLLTNGETVHGAEIDENEAFAQLREKYIAGVHKRFASMERLVSALEADPADAAATHELLTHAHTMHGSAGVYGFHAMGDIAAEWENELKAILGDEAESEAATVSEYAIRRFRKRLSAMESECRNGISAPVEEGAAVSGAAPARPTNELDVLLVEDDTAIQRMISYALKARGYSVEVIGDGDAVIGRLSAQSHAPTPKVLLLDVNLPGTDGFTLLDELRASGQAEKMKIVMLTAQNREEAVVRGLESGAADYVTKPFSILILMEKIKLLLKQ